MPRSTRVFNIENIKERGYDDAAGIYPDCYTDYRTLRTIGRIIATTKWRLSGKRAKRFASIYAEAYLNERDVLDRILAWEQSRTED